MAKEVPDEVIVMLIKHAAERLGVVPPMLCRWSLGGELFCDEMRVVITVPGVVRKESEDGCGEGEDGNITRQK